MYFFAFYCILLHFIAFYCNLLNFIAGDWSCPHCEMFGPEEHLWNWNRTVLYKKPLEGGNGNEWVKDALGLPDVSEEILDVEDDDDDAYSNLDDTSIVIDPDLGSNHLLL